MGEWLGLGAVSEGVGWREWAPRAARAGVSTRCGQLRKETQRRGLNVSAGRVRRGRRGRAKVVESGWEGGVRDWELAV